MHIEVHSSHFCPYCIAAKNLLIARGLEFAEKMYEGPDARHELRLATGGMSFPQILIDGENIGGFRELQQLDKSGRLG